MFIRIFYTSKFVETVGLEDVFAYSEFPISNFLTNKTNNGHPPTPIPGAFGYPWTLPRAKNCSPALIFYTSLRTGAALSSPRANQKSPTPNGVGLFWQGHKDLNPEPTVLE